MLSWYFESFVKQNPNDSKSQTAKSQRYFSFRPVKQIIITDRQRIPKGSYFHFTVAKYMLLLAMYDSVCLIFFFQQKAKQTY